MCWKWFDQSQILKFKIAVDRRSENIVFVISRQWIVTLSQILVRKWKIQESLVTGECENFQNLEIQDGHIAMKFQWNITRFVKILYATVD